MSEHITRLHREAVDRVRAELAKPLPERDFGSVDEFDPWELFPSLYGSYSSDFDDMALDVLRTIQLASEDRWDDVFERQAQETLAHQMFREMLCTADLCDYGTSPRVCFATTDFKEVLPELIAKWEVYSKQCWDSSHE